MSKLTLKVVGCHRSWLCARLDIVGHVRPFIFCKDVIEEVFNLLVKVVGIAMVIGIAGCKDLSPIVLVGSM
jgi:hypothetical protein